MFWNSKHHRRSHDSLRSRLAKATVESLEDRLMLTLIGHWAFDDDNGDSQADDSSGNGNHGIIQGASFISGQVGQALDFDGSNDYVDLNQLDVGGSDLSIAGWINADSFLGTYRDARIVSKAAGVNTQDHYWMISTIREGANTRLRFRLKAGGSTDTLVASSGNLVLGQWHHMAATYDGSAMRLYLNGIEVGSRAKSGPLATNPAVDAYIGSNPVVSKPFDGRIDDVRIYNEALSQAAIQNLMNGSNTAPTITSAGGGPTASVNVAENQTSVTDVQSIDDNDSEGAGLTYSLTGGADQALFSIVANTGVLTFQSAPDFENPLDSGGNNVYDVQVTVTDSGSLTDEQDISVMVTDVAEQVGLVGHWAFDDDNGDSQADDSSGNGNHGVVQGASFASGQIGQALDFDGSNDYVDLNQLDVGGAALSIAGWINADSFLGSYRDGRIISKATGVYTQDHYWMISTFAQGANTRLRFRLKTGGSTDTLVASSGNLALGQWHHVAATYDGSTMRLYLDGVAVGSRAKTGAINTNAAADAYIGNNPVVSNPFDGRIDDVRIYNEALSQSAIQNLMNGSNAAPTITSDGGGPTANVNVAENQTSVTDVQSIDDNDSEGAGLTYSLTGGADQALFSVAANTGVLTFQSAPDFENPLDSGGNNVYDVQVTVTDSGSLTDVQDISVMVTDVAEGGLSDDFSSGVLNPAWTFVDPLNDATLEFEGAGTAHAFLKLAVPPAVEHSAWSTNTAPRVMRSIADTNFELETKFAAVPTKQYQSQGILVEQDAGNYLRFDVYSNGASQIAFAASVKNSVATSRIVVPISLSDAMFMRVGRAANVWTLSYSDDGQNWTTAGSFVENIAPATAGVFAGNCCGAGSPGFVSLVDYFFDTSAPIVPEDGVANSSPIGKVPTPDVVVSENSSNQVVSLSDAFFDLDPGDALTLSVSTNSNPGLVSTNLVGTNLTLSFTAANTGTAEITVRATDPGGLFVEDTFRVDVHAAGSPVIDVWHGSSQNFGQLGQPQAWVNVLGNVWDADGVSTLTYTLNGGTITPLTIGPDGGRLESLGDFNIDLPVSSLNAGANQLVIFATDSLNQNSMSKVTVHYTPATVWPNPYTLDWSATSDPQSVAQVVDGNWDASGSAPSEPSYDRLLAIGDVTWDDYEVEVPVTINDVDLDTNNCDCNALGFVMRWQGHLIDGHQPYSGVYNFGALALYRWDGIGSNERLWMASNGNTVIVSDNTGKRLIPGLTYIMKARVETTPAVGGSLYQLKVWRESDPEPATWDLTMQTSGEGTSAGSLLLLAHYTNVTFGNVSVTPVGGAGANAKSPTPSDVTTLMNSIRVKSEQRLQTPSVGRGFFGDSKSIDVVPRIPDALRPEWDVERLERPQLLLPDVRANGPMNRWNPPPVERPPAPSLEILDEALVALWDDDSTLFEDEMRFF